MVQYDLKYDTEGEMSIVFPYFDCAKLKLTFILFEKLNVTLISVNGTYCYLVFPCQQSLELG